MRFILASVTVLVLGAAAAIFGWQQTEIRHLRAQMAEQNAAFAAKAPRASVDHTLGLSAEERRFVLTQYQDVLTKMDLPPTKAARLQDLLTKRIAVALDAQEDAAREGFAQGSPEMARAESSAIAGVDQDIARLLGSADDQRLVMLTTGSYPTPPTVVPAPPAPPVVVNVINQMPAGTAYAPAYSDDSSPAVDAYPAPGPYYAYPPPAYYYPYAAVVVGRSFDRPFGGARPFFNNARAPERQRFEPVRSNRPSYAGGERVVGRSR